MSINTQNDLGVNISKAVQVVKETYQNLNILFAELDRIGEQEGYSSLTPRFLRKKSDLNTDGWLISNFIKLYQLKNEADLLETSSLDVGALFGIEVELSSGEEDYPTISIIKYTFDFSQWTRTPAVSDHWLFWNPFRIEKHFEIDQKDNIWISKTRDEAKTRYMGLESAVAIDLPLISINSPEDISSLIFQKFESLG